MTQGDDEGDADRVGITGWVERLVQGAAESQRVSVEDRHLGRPRGVGQLGADDNLGAGPKKRPYLNLIRARTGRDGTSAACVGRRYGE